MFSECSAEMCRWRFWCRNESSRLQGLEPSSHFHVSAFLFTFSTLMFQWNLRLTFINAVLTHLDCDGASVLLLVLYSSFSSVSRWICSLMMCENLTDQQTDDFWLFQTETKSTAEKMNKHSERLYQWDRFEPKPSRCCHTLSSDI